MILTGLEAQKQALRLKSRSILQGLPSSVRKVKSRKIQHLFMRTRVYKNAQKVLFYASFGLEPDTWPVIRAAHKAGKMVFLPRVLEHKRLGIYEVQDLKRDLKKGAFGIWEPLPKDGRKARPQDMDLMVVPGLAFDSRGRRLGRGQGFYDRLLSGKGKAVLAAFGFDEQRVRKVPAGPLDQRVEMLVTDKGIYRVYP